jgi:hypothetical protein
MQSSAAALEQILISSILGQCTLEAVIGIRRQAPHQQDIGLGPSGKAQTSGGEIMPF